MQAGQPITFNGTSANRKIVDLESIASSNPLTITASKLTVSGDVDIQGVLNTVTGTETVFEDTILVLNQSDTTGTVADTSAALVSGIEINRSFAGEASLKWDDSVDLWKLRGGSGLEVHSEQSGLEGGNIALTTNDGRGNANITFNHARGAADKDGNAGRIEVNVDRASADPAYMDFEVGDNVTQGTTEIFPTLRLRDNGATADRPTLEINNNLWIDGGVASDRTTSQSLTDTYPDMKGQIRFDNTWSDVARGPNKIVIHDNGSSWVGGFGLSSSTLDSYSGTNFRWSRMEGPSATPVQKMHLDGSGNLEVTGKMTIGTGPTAELDVATKGYVDGKFGSVDLSTCAIKSESNTFTADQTISGHLSVSGKIGIGTTSPVRKLDVMGDIRIHDTSYTRLEWYNDSDAIDPADFWIAEHHDAGNFRIMRRDNDAGSWGYNLCLQADGKVGVGTPTPSERLEVNGNIKATNMLIGTEQVLHTGNLPVTAANVDGDTVYTFGSL